MPSRRSLLAAGGTAATAALAGCSLAQQEGREVAHSGEDLRLAEKMAVARARTERTDCPHGAVILEAMCYDPPQEGLVCWTGTSIVPGRNRNPCDGDWVQNGVDVGHHWAALRPYSKVSLRRDTDLVPTSNAPRPYRLDDTVTEQAVRWTVRTRGDAGRSTTAHQFLSTFGPIDDVSDGRDLVEISVEVPLSGGGLLGDSETLSLSTTLTHGDTEP